MLGLESESTHARIGYRNINLLQTISSARRGVFPVPCCDHIRHPSLARVIGLLLRRRVIHPLLPSLARVGGVLSRVHLCHGLLTLSMARVVGLLLRQRVMAAPYRIPATCCYPLPPQPSLPWGLRGLRFRVYPLPPQPSIPSGSGTRT